MALFLRHTAHFIEPRGSLVEVRSNYVTASLNNFLNNLIAHPPKTKKIGFIAGDIIARDS